MRWLAPVLLGACCTRGAGAEPDPWAMLARLPSGVDAAAVLDRPGTRLWSEPAGRAVRRALSATGAFSQTERAWAGLAAALGYTENEAAAALLGGPVLVAWDGLNRSDASPGGAAGRADTRWAVVAGVEPATARSVRERLRAAPRRTVAGRVVYTVDAGRTAMAVVDGPEGTRVVFAPVSASGLLDALLGGPAAPAAPADGTPGPVGEAGRAVLGEVRPGWLAVAAVRMPGERPLAFELRPDAPGALSARFALESGPIDGPGAPVGVLSEVGGDALLAAAFRGGPRFGRSSMDLGVRLGLTGRDGPDGPLSPGRGSVLVLHAVEPAPGTPGVAAQLIGHLRSETPSAETVDRTLSAAIGGDNPPHHRGAFPDAVRTHDLPLDDDARSAWPGPGGRVAWCLAPDGPGAVDAADDAADDAAGAVSVAVTPLGIDPAAFARKGREAWERASDHDPAVLTAGRARPRELAARLGAPASAVSDLAASIETVEWSVRARDGVVNGDLRVRFAEPGPRLGAP